MFKRHLRYVHVLPIFFAILTDSAVKMTVKNMFFTVNMYRNENIVGTFFTVKPSF